MWWKFTLVRNGKLEESKESYVSLNAFAVEGLGDEIVLRGEKGIIGSGNYKGGSDFHCGCYRCYYGFYYLYRCNDNITIRIKPIMKKLNITLIMQ